ncbi:DedA family protein [Rickettsiales bacterium]|nr:DedA family protein [Rickettsiales bacterium]
MEILTNYFDIILNYLVIFIEKVGYLGIFIGMFLESTFFPVPSEIIMIPAGISAATGKFNIYLVIFFGTFGSLAGALFNYFIALHFGRVILFKIGKYFFIKPANIIKIEEYFKRHGHISTFIGRLIPLIRQYISLPAGIARMNLAIFSLYTTAGALIWCTILTYLGFIIGDNKELIKEYLHICIIICLLICFIVALLYIKINSKR